MFTMIGVFIANLTRRARGTCRAAMPARAVAPAAVAAAVCALLLALAPGTARAEGRVALVIGNAAYSALQPLANPVNDAKGIAAALERVGFEVTLLTDAPQARLAPVLEAFAARAESADTVLFYYSGHAFQQNGQNLLVPADAALADAEAVAGETWSFSDDIVARLSGAGRQALFFLDACRNNPLPLALRGASGEGLAKPDTGTGSFVAFATQPGAVARDGVGANSPFTLAMLKNMETPGISISDLMIAVRNEVVAATKGTQVPWDQSSLRAQFYFVPVEEDGTAITEADLEAIGGLDAESIRNVVGALAENGVTLEILTVEDDSTEIADATPNPIIAIDDVGDAVAVPATGEGEGESAGEGDGERVAMLDDTRSVGPAEGETTADASSDAAGAGAAEAAAPTLADRVAAAEAVVAAAQARASTGPTEAQLEAVALPESLPLGIQQQLSRVGCHRAAIDGVWGKVSRISLLRYYTAKGKVSAREARAEPTERAYRRLALEPGVVCEGVVAAPVRTASARAGSTRTIVRKAPAPTAKPPSSSGTRRIQTKPTTSSSGARVPPRINRAKPGVFR